MDTAVKRKIKKSPNFSFLFKHSTFPFQSIVARLEGVLL